MSSSRDDGEIEEGELPGEFSSPQEAETDTKAVGSSYEQERPVYSYMDAEAVPSSSAPYGVYTEYFEEVNKRNGLGSYSDGYLPRSSERYKSKDGYSYWSEHDGSDDEYEDSDREAERQRKRTEAMFDRVSYLTNHTSLPDAMRNLDSVCRDLLAAMDILVELHEHEKDGESIDSFEMERGASKLFKGLRTVHVASGTGAGKTQNLESAKAVMKAAWAYKDDIFISQQCKDLEKWISSSKVFKSLLTEEVDRKQRHEQHAAGGDAKPLEKVADKADTKASAGGTDATGTSTGAANGTNAAAAQDGVKAAREAEGTGGVAESRAIDADLIHRAKRARTSSVVGDVQQQREQQQAADGVTSSKQANDAHAHAQTNGHAEVQPQSTMSNGRCLAPSQAHGNPRAAADDALHETNTASAPGGPAAAADGEASPPLSPSLQLNEAELARVLETSSLDLLKQGKLCLVLDLDHTLLNSAKFTELSKEVEYSLQQRLLHEQTTMGEEQRELFRLPKVGMWTKLRPGVREFLQRAHQRFELWIHTNGNRAYASAVVEVLDPHQTYFGSRLIAQGAPADSSSAVLMTKRLMAGLEGREPVSIIVDDSQAVWPHDLRNLLVVERYVYFPSQLNKPGQNALLELNRDECPFNGMLITAINVVERVHTSVFKILSASPSTTPKTSPHRAPPSPPSHTDWDVRVVLSAERRKVLAGCTIVFSRVIPLETDPAQHHLWKLAESYGAVCSSRLGADTTHLIAGAAGTDKVHWARQHQKFVVAVHWLEASCILWQRAREDQFALQG